MPAGGGITLATIATITAITGGAAATYGGIASARNAKLRREYEQNLAALNVEEKKRLEQQLLEAKDLEAKRLILQETLGKATQTRIEAIAAKKMEAQKTLNKLTLIGGVGAVVLVIGFILIAVKRKKK